MPLSFSAVKKMLLIAVAIATAILQSTANADEIVRAAQQKLKRFGYYRGMVDGQWGSQTAAAVRRYQLAKRLKVTGELNRQTIESLAIMGSPATPKSIALAELFVGGPYLSAPPEFQVRTVRRAKQNLKLLGYYDGPINGDPSASLVEALKAYQRSARFSQTGRLDRRTLEALDLLHPIYFD